MDTWRDLFTKRWSDFADPLHPYFADPLQEMIQEEMARRERAKEPANAWLKEVLSFSDVDRRLGCLRQPAPTPDDLPSPEEALAYAFATDTLASEHFTDYITAREFCYWESEQERADLERVAQAPCILNTCGSHP